ncbi:MAG: hypothetical protein LPK07_11740 [Hymenobacteraceae bacterium]|nr:hypothetical protein [Hymenobacteraceae bacterium]
MKKLLLPLLPLLLFFAAHAQSQPNCSAYTHDPGIPPVENVKASTLQQRKGSYDFSWLNRDLKANKVVLIGENHWMASVQAAARDLVFHLNDVDRYPVLVLEVPFSVSPFINSYINCQTDTCDQFLNILKPYYSSREEVSFLNQLRDWNATHPDKQLTVVCSDTEQEYMFSLRNVLSYYFKQQGHDDFWERLRKADNDNDLVLAYLDSLLQQSPEGFSVKGRPYLDKAFVGNVLDNLKTMVRAREGMNKARREGRGEAEAFEVFMRLRTAGIIDNLTSEAKYGRLIRENKVILWGGSTHMRTQQLPGEQKQTHEGWYLAHEYAPTKGRVLSIKLDNLAYTIPEAYYTSDSYRKRNAQFARLVDLYKRCNKEGSGSYYGLINKPTGFTSAVVAKFKANQDQPVWLKGNGQLRKLVKKSPALLKDRQLSDYAAHDYVIVFPHSLLFEQND